MKEDNKIEEQIQNKNDEPFKEEHVESEKITEENHIEVTKSNQEEKPKEDINPEEVKQNNETEQHIEENNNNKEYPEEKEADIVKETNKQNDIKEEQEITEKSESKKAFSNTDNDNNTYNNSNTGYSNLSSRKTPYSSNPCGFYHTNKPPSSKSTKSNKSTKIDKKNPAYLYLKELQRSQEYMKKRNQTARLYKSKMNFHFDKTSDSSIGLGHFSKTNTQFPSKVYKKKENILEKKHNQMLNQMNDPKNPYSTYWSSKILDKRYNMKFEVTGFLNGVPVINVQKKKNDVSELIYNL